MKLIPVLFGLFLALPAQGNEPQGAYVATPRFQVISDLAQPWVIYASQGNYLTFATGEHTTLTIAPNGRVKWRGRWIKGDAEFRRAMMDVSLVLRGKCAP